MGLLKELQTFFVFHKKLWLAIIILILFIFGTLLSLAQGLIVTPIIYTLF